MFPVRTLSNAVPKLCRQSTGARHLSISTVRNIKSITVQEKGDKIVVEGKYESSPREKYLAKGLVSQQGLAILGSSQNGCACPLCKLDLQIKHTDVLILAQFTNSKGKLLPQNVTSLCKEQHKRVEYLLVMAEKAGLIDVYSSTGKRELTGWEQFNKYYDERSVEEMLQYKIKKAY